MSVIGYSADDCWKRTIEYIMASGEMHGSRNGEMREVRGFSMVNLNPGESLTSRGGTVSIRYATTELLWYMSRTRSVEMLLRAAPQYANFANDGMAMGAYGHRWAHNAEADQLVSLLKLLLDKPDTRQAVVTMWDAHDLAESNRGEWRDIPCTLSMQFMLRDGALDMVTTMRSNDAWLGLPYDMFCFCEIMRLVAAVLSVKIGKYYHNVGSMHVYSKNIDKAVEAARSQFNSRPCCDGVIANPKESIAAGLLLGCIPEVTMLDDIKMREMAESLNDEWFTDIVAGMLGNHDIGNHQFKRADFVRALNHKDFNNRRKSC